MTRGLINRVALTVQKPYVFKDYSILVVFDAYLTSMCSTPDVHPWDDAGLVVIRSLRTALGLPKEERLTIRVGGDFSLTP